MLDWLRLVLMIFYAPIRGMRAVRDRAALAPAACTAFLAVSLYLNIAQLMLGNRSLVTNGLLFGLSLFQAALAMVPVALILIPLLTLVANIFDRRGSFGVVITQEYAAVASVVFYVLAAACLATTLIVVFFHFSGIQASYVANAIQNAPRVREMFRSFGPEFDARVALQLADPAAIAEVLFLETLIGLLSIGLVLGVREVFRVSGLRAFTITLVTAVGMMIVWPLWFMLFSRLFGSPFLLLMLVLFLRGYVTDILKTQRSRAAFKRNLEAATLNPADASAHYNIGLIHQQRGELDAACERFERAVQIDAEEIDAHYQLGRIARQQKRVADAIGHFEQVVARNPAHSQYEIWREVGATYIAAGQYDDARTALERFLEHRESDPEGLYLMGRAHAGLGHRREAASLMEACINAVKTAPAYTYRLEKRCLNEAQQLLKSSGQEAVGR
jgi:tetratricopeptide (TPR) repeat protein